MDYTKTRSSIEYGAVDSTERSTKLQPVAKGNIRESKRSKFADAFSLADINDIRDYAVKSVLIPFAKDAVVRLVKYALKVDTGSTLSSRYDFTSTRSLYNSASSIYNSAIRSQDASAVFRWDEICYDTYGEAELVKDKLYTVCKEYEKPVSILDLYDISERTYPGPHSAKDYGWYIEDINKAKVVALSGDKYGLRLPPARPITRR